jgi:hypothetical protein
MTTKENIFDIYAQAYESQKQHRMSLKEYLEGCKSDPSLYASTAERMLRAIGEPELVDTAKDPRLGRIFMNRTIKVYSASRISTAWRRPSSASSASSVTDRRAWRRRSRSCICWARSEAASRRLPTASRT